MKDTTPNANNLTSLMPEHDFFIGIDSDGCAFDAMEIKHKECFCPNTIKHWQLQAISKYAREAWEFVNLYSKWRGTNRWLALVKALDVLRARLEVISRGVSIAQLDSVRAFIDSGSPLSDTGLREYMKTHSGEELERALRWTSGVNQAVADMVHGVPPFPFVKESLAKMQKCADLMVVSATPCEALNREWAEHGLREYMRAVAGQEYGTKTQQLSLAASGKYAPDHILKIGDALGDLEAAKNNGVCFYPILPGREEESWKRFYDEASERFINGTYTGTYERNLINEFENLLPTNPPWA